MNILLVLLLLLDQPSQNSSCFSPDPGGYQWIAQADNIDSDPQPSFEVSLIPDVLSTTTAEQLGSALESEELSFVSVDELLGKFSMRTLPPWIGINTARQINNEKTAQSSPALFMDSWPRAESMYQLTMEPEFTTWTCSGTMIGLMSFEEFMNDGWKLFASPDFPRDGYPPCSFEHIWGHWSRFTMMSPEYEAFDPWSFFPPNSSEFVPPLLKFWLIDQKRSVSLLSETGDTRFETLLHRFEWSESERGLLIILSPLG